MKRFFITQHPKFGRTEPNKSLIEKSPYYYWWLALTLNEDYLSLCEQMPAKQTNETETKALTTYRDFGDVRYTGDKYSAFKEWWKRKVSADETKGEYLFAEPLSATKVELIEESEAAQQASNDASSLLIRVPKTFGRRQIDNAIDRILAKEMTFEEGWQVRNPNRSNARYHLSVGVKIENLKTAFDVYEELKAAEENNEKISNTKLAKKVGLKVQRRVKDEAYDRAYEARITSMAISRKKKLASDAISNVINGIFP